MSRWAVHVYISVDHLIRIIARANISTPEETFELIETDSAWTDVNDNILTAKNGDDMGFGHFH